MNYNKKRMIVALHLTVSSVMLLSGFTSPGTKMNTAGDLRYAGGEIAVQIGDSVVDGTISMIKGTKQVSQSVQTAGDVWKTEAVRIEEMIRAEEERAAEEARIAEEQAAQAAALEATQLEAANVMAGGQAERVIKLYERAGLPTRIPDYIDREELVKKLYTDKKVRDGKLRFVLQKGIGATVEFAPGVYAKPIEESLAREIIMEL